MVKKLLFLQLLLFSFTGIINGQNLVHNPGFEDLNGCPDELGNIDDVVKD